MTDQPSCPVPHHPNRRSFLAAGMGSLAALGLAGCTEAGRDNADSASSSASPDGGAGSSTNETGASPAVRVPFAGAHQNAIFHSPIGRLSSTSSFKVMAKDRDELAKMFEDLTSTIADLMAGRPVESRDSAYPPAGTGILGDELRPDHLGIVVSVGASLFDDRFGLRDRKPKELVEMPFLANDRLDPARSHGDLLITIEADHDDTVQHALRQVMRATRKTLLLNWNLGGYTRGAADQGSETPRNLMGFKDGTNNLKMSDEDVLNKFVWVSKDDGEPEWAVGGTYHAVRVIRMFVEFWDRTQLAEQEAIFGRKKISGAPLGSDDEFADVSFDNDPKGEVIGLDAHIRLANPRTEETAGDRMLRRGFSYHRGVDNVGRLDQGLGFVSFQRKLQQFLNVQERLAGEPLEEYILPEGGGFFFALPGVPDEKTSLGAKLLA